MVILAAILVGSMIVAGVIAPRDVNQGFRDAASVLAFVSLAAVTIERIIEGFFSLLASRLGEWWPLKIVRAEFDRFEAETNTILGPVVDDTLAQLTAAKALFGAADPKIEQINGLIANVTAEQARLRTLYDEVTAKIAPGSDRLARIGEINTRMSAELHRVHMASGEATATAQAALRTATDSADRAAAIISSFQDNPARRVASLLLGASLGVLVAGGVGLNLFAATLIGQDGSTSQLPVALAGAIGVILTGVVIGLGSAPTHEVVKSLQAYREARTPSVPVTNVTTGGGSASSQAAMASASVQAALGSSAVLPAGGLILEAPMASPIAGPDSPVPATMQIRRVRRTG